MLQKLMSLGLHWACNTKVLFACSMKPVVVLTDLKEDYTFYWPHNACLSCAQLQRSLGPH